MGFFVFNGTYEPALGVPDGDSVKFVLSEPDLLRLQAVPRQGRPPKLNAANGSTTLRFEGIDAMEKSARPTDTANVVTNATEAMFAALDLDGPDATAPGHIYTRLLGPFGRPIAFCFPGPAPDDIINMDNVFLTAERAAESANARLLAEGHAYPLFYTTLFDDLKEMLTAASAGAENARLGVWEEDATLSGVTYRGPESLAALAPLFPKLWRRLQSYTRDEDFEVVAGTLDQFPDFLDMTDDRVFVGEARQTTGFDNVVEVSGDMLRLTEHPARLTFV